MPSATYVIEVNWNGDGVTFVDETAYLHSVEWTRGRDYASQLTGRAIPGELHAILENIGGRFSPRNASGALYGSLVPGRRVRWKTTAPSATTLWQGFLDDIIPDPGSRDTPGTTCTLRASGPLKFLSEREASTAVVLAIATGTAVGKVLDDAGWPAGDRTIDAGQVTMTRWKADGQKATTALHELEETEFGYIGESADGKIVFEDSHHRLISPHTVSQATFSDAAAAALFYDAISELDPWREIFNRFTADVQLYTVQSIATLWAMTGQQPSISPGQSIDIWTDYPGPSAATQADHVDAWTTPVATTDFLANAASDGSGSNLTSSISVAASKFANSMKITLTNTGTITAFITFLQARGTAVYKNDPVGVATEDATSQTAYGKRTYPLPGRWYPTIARALSFVQYGLSRFKDPVAVIALTFRADQTAAHLTQALTRDISERITLVASGTSQSGAGLGISEDFYIESMQHKYDLHEHTVTYQLSSAAADGGYWVLGVSTLGNTTKLNV